MGRMRLPRSGIELDGSSLPLSALISFGFGGGGGGGGLMVAEDPGDEDDVDDTIPPAGIRNSFTLITSVALKTYAGCIATNVPRSH